MKTFVQLFISSGLFGVAIAVTYWYVAHEETTGTALLGVMTAALFLTAAYAIVAERNARLAGDDAEPTRASTAGEDLGIFTTHSPWPVVLALCALGALCGAVWSPFLAAASLCGLLLSLWRLGRESAQT